MVRWRRRRKRRDMFNLFSKKEIAEKPPEQKREEQPGWLEKLTAGLTQSTAQLAQGMAAILTKKKLDDETLEQLEELLIKADLGPTTAGTLISKLRQSRFGKEVSDEDIRCALAGEIAVILKPVAATLDFEKAKPFVLLMVGVNGVGKTTTMGKLAKQLKDKGKTTLMVAGDTFRAAAVQQLDVWAQRAGAVLVKGAEQADPASLAFKGIEQAKAQNVDVVMIDTAGRLHNKTELMAELEKIIRVIKKHDNTAPHATLLALDATSGQNALQQARVFLESAAISGLIVTKLDGSARGGVLVALAEMFKLPVYAIGVGEGIDDLRPFDADDFAAALCGVSR